MDWSSVVFTWLVLLVIREFKSWWLSSAQTNVGDTIVGKVMVDKATQHQDETESRPTTPNTSKGAPLNITPSNPLCVRNVGEATATAATQPGTSETGEKLQGHTPGLTNTVGYLNHAHNFVLNQPVFNETEEKILQWLAGSTMSGAEFDARGHVPSCHPGTRMTILESLHNWIDDLQRAYQVLWLHGPAGVGKSAIIQSLAEGLAKTSKLGASLFFSRPNERNNPALVFPTIAYQLAIRIPRYREYLRRKMLEDPKLLEKDMAQQFNILIVEPFNDPNFMAECGMWAILLDGLDECNGEDAQVHVITLISSLSLQYPGLPLVWFIASRPEAHLQHAFASNGIRGSFEEHDVPASSNEGCRDVERFLRAKFEEIREKYKDLIPIGGTPWPVEQDITRISGTSLGLFALATTVVRYIEDPYVCNPISQLAIVVSVTRGLEPGSLSALHTIYSTILDGVPKDMWPILRLLLHLYAPSSSSVLDDVTDSKEDIFPLVWIATLWGLQQHTVYGALRRLHSVVKVPPPEDSGRLGIRFYHASFPDYLEAVSREYKRDHKELAVKRWWGYFKMLHEGNSSSYQRAIECGRPPIQLSWDSHFRDDFWDSIWGRGLAFLTWDLEPIEHIQSLLTRTELQDVLEKIDFSALLFRRHHSIVFTPLFGFVDRFIGGVPPELVRSNLVKIIPLRDLDLTWIPEGKLAHESLWTSRARERPNQFVGPQRRQFDRKPEFHGSHQYIDAPPESLHPEWHRTAQPLKDLITKLERLRSDDPTMQVLIVGRAPSKCCIFICVEPQLEEHGKFYYVPYGQ